MAVLSRSITSRKEGTMSLQQHLGTRRNPTKLRLALTVALVFIVISLMNAFVWPNVAKASPVVEQTAVVQAAPILTCNQGNVFTEPGFSATQQCNQSLNEAIGKDMRVMAGNAATACAAGWWFSGPVGCKIGVVGAVLSAIPWDGTWE